MRYASKLLHKAMSKKSQNIQILTKGPKERYVVDLVEIINEIKDEKLILNIY